MHALLEKHCAYVGLAHNAETAAQAQVTRSWTRTRKRQTVFAPSAGSIKLYPEAPPAKVAAQRKRKASPEPAAGEHESPSASKRSKDAPCAPSGLGRDLDTHTTRAGRGNAAASARTDGAVGLDGDEDEEDHRGPVHEGTQ